MNRISVSILTVCIVLIVWVCTLYSAEGTDNQHVGMYSPGLMADWERSLREKGLKVGANERDIYVSVGQQTVDLPINHPGFHESRSIAYEIAYLRAKAEMIKFLAASIEKSNSYESLENARWSDGQGEALDRLKKTSRIIEKVKDLAEKKLDQELAEIDPNYDPDKYGSREEKEKAFRGAFKQQIREVASRFVSGAIPLEVLEGPTQAGNSYEILVGLVWSRRLELAARAVRGGNAPTNTGKTGIRISDWLPKRKETISASWGVNKMIDENGDQVFIGFGQAAPRKSSPSRRSRSEEAALRRAEIRAKGAIRGFVGEVIRSESSEEGDQISIEYANAATSNVVGSTFVEKLKSTAKAISLTGLTVVGRWIVPHPANNQRVAIVAVSWSPKGLATAKRVKDAMRNPRKKRSAKAAPKTKKPNPKLLRRENIKLKDL